MGYFIRWWLFGFLVGGFFSKVGMAQAIAPGFTHHVWTVDDGLPINSLNDITVTDDGFIWISTHNGMVRFDGLTRSEGNLFTLVNKGNNEAFSSNSLYKILEINGSEFFVLENSVGESQSVIRYKDGVFENVVSSEEISFPYDMARLDTNFTFWDIHNGKPYSLTNGKWKDEFPSIQLDLDIYVEFQVISKDNIWILSKKKGELYHIKNGETQRIGKDQGLTSDIISAFEVDNSGNVWLLTGNGIEIIEDGKASFLHPKLARAEDGKGSLNIDPAIKGRMIYKRGNDYGNDEYIVTKDEIQYLPSITSDSFYDNEKRSFLITPKNSTNTDTGWLRINNKLYYDGYPVFELGQNIRGSRIDESGGIWFVAVGELHYIRKNTFDSYNKLSHNIENVYPIMEDHEGVIWTGLLKPHVSRKQSSKMCIRDRYMSSGVSKVNMDEIASELRVSKKTIYKFFPSKQDLLRGVVELFTRRVRKKVKRIVESDNTFEKKMIDLMFVLGEMLGKMSKQFVLDLQNSSPALWQEIETFRSEHILSHLYEMFEQAKREHIFRADVDIELFHMVFISSVESIVNPKVLTQQSFSAKEAFNGIMKLLIEGALTPEAKEKYDFFGE